LAKYYLVNSENDVMFEMDLCEECVGKLHEIVENMEEVCKNNCEED
jgi:hypothetical protein